MTGSHIWINKEVFEWLLQVARNVQENLKLEYRPSFNKTLLYIKKDLESVKP